MKIENILDFFNALIIHYRKVDIKFMETPLLQEVDLIKLYMGYGSVEKMFESIVLRFEEDVTIDEEYLTEVFKEFNINRELANKVLKQSSQPKEPSFSRKALAKKPSFTKENLIENTNRNQPSSNRNTEEPVFQNDDKADDVLNVISFLIPLVGLVYYASNNETKPIKSASAGKSAIIGAVVEIIIWFLYYRWIMSEIKSITSF